MLFLLFQTVKKKIAQKQHELLINTEHLKMYLVIHSSEVAVSPTLELIRLSNNRILLVIVLICDFLKGFFNTGLDEDKEVI